MPLLAKGTSKNALLNNTLAGTNRFSTYKPSVKNSPYLMQSVYLNEEYFKVFVLFFF